MARLDRSAMAQFRDWTIPALVRWSRQHYSVPAPKVVKHRVINRYGSPGNTWIETGTYRADTALFLAKQAQHVFTIEPSPSLASYARRRLKGATNVTLIEQDSEHALPDVLNQVSGPVSFWLDGHFSGGITFRGQRETPIEIELQLVDRALNQLDLEAILIDDFRLFGPGSSSLEVYPPRDFLVDWARGRGFNWDVEHDIFVIKR